MTSSEPEEPDRTTDRELSGADELSPEAQRELANREAHRTREEPPG
ncbi:hypothetical protein [Amycolatopsis albispora]|nr:hypothetical protein [Amycolatopsis albispora]